MQKNSTVRRYIIGSVFMLGAATTAGWHAFRPGSKPVVKQLTTQAESAQAPADAPPFSGIAVTAAQRPWERGVSRLYSADFSSTFEGDKSAPDGTATLAGSATLLLVATSRDSERTVLRGTLTDVSLVVDTPPDEPKHVEDSVGAEISKPFMITLGSSGSVDSLSVDRQLQGLGFNILRMLVASLQFVVPPGKNPDLRAWVTRETDQNGRYDAHYRQLELGQFEKRKQYTFLDVADKLQLGKSAPPPTASAEATLTRTVEGVLQNVQTKESLDVPMGQGKGFHSDSHVTITLKEVGVSRDTAVDPLLLVAAPLFETRAGDAASKEAERDRELVGHASFDDLQSNLDELPPTNENRDARWSVTRRMTALFNTDPASVDTAVLKLRRNPKAGDGEVLLAALSDARVPEAQAALTRVAQDAAVPADVRQAAVTQLSLNEHPTADTLSELNRMSQDTTDPDRRAAATLALGGAARHSADDPQLSDQSQQATGQLVNSFKTATTPGDQAMYLAALGNTGSPQGIESIKVGLASSDPQVRAAAVSALRLIPGEVADALIAGVLVSDPNPGVRGTAVQAMNTRPLSDELGTALTTAAHTDQAANVRLQIVQLLADKLSESQAAATLLAWIAQNDPDPDVKGAAAKAIKN